MEVKLPLGDQFALMGVLPCLQSDGDKFTRTSKSQEKDLGQVQRCDTLSYSLLPLDSHSFSAVES